MTPVFALNCYGNRLEVFEDTVRITPVGAFQKSLREAKTLPISSITAVHLTNWGPGASKIQLTVAGGNQSRGGFFAAFSDENTVVFDRTQNDPATKIKEYIEFRMSLTAASASVWALIGTHVRALALKRRQLVYADPYGVANTQRWDKEKEYFYDAVVRTSITGSSDYWKLVVSTWIEQAIAAFESSPGSSSSPLSTSVEEMSAWDYERHCAELLVSLGWAARVTKGSGDQGADVIAEKDGLRIVLQCKKYSTPVGNKAVQEVLSAMKFEDAEFAAVVSNMRFTPAAEALAHKGGIALLHHSELDRLEQLARLAGNVPEAVDPLN